MQKINKLIDLTQQLVEAMEDKDLPVYHMMISSSTGQVSFLADAEFMLSNLGSVDITLTDQKDLPFKLETEIDGVTFSSHVHLERLDILRGHISDDWIEDLKNPEKNAHEILQHRSLCNKDSYYSLHEKSPHALACE